MVIPVHCRNDNRERNTAAKAGWLPMKVPPQSNAAARLKFCSQNAVDHHAEPHAAHAKPIPGNETAKPTLTA